MTRIFGGGVRPWARVLPGLAVLATVLALSAGCGGSTAAEPGASAGADRSGAPSVLRPATLQAGQPLPAPAGKAILTITGRLSAANHGRPIALDLAGLGRLRQVEVHVYEPWVKKDVDFRGVWLQDLLAAAGVAAGATSLQITALDDYSVILSLADVRAGGILVATGDGAGAHIAIADGGPTRIVFLKGLPAGANADQWVWSLKTIDVR
jgi:hypothetical protein